MNTHVGVCGGSKTQQCAPVMVTVSLSLLAWLAALTANCLDLPTLLAAGLKGCTLPPQLASRCDLPQPCNKLAEPPLGSERALN